MRDEAARVLDSVRDTIAIGERGGLPTQVTHHKIIGKVNWGKSVDTLRLVDEARARGVDVTIDQYPVHRVEHLDSGRAGPAVGAGGRTRADARSGFATRPSAARCWRPSPRRSRPTAAVAIRPTSCSRRARGIPSLAGKSLAQVLRDRGRPVTIPRAAELVVEIVEKGGCSAIYHAINEDDLVRIMQHPATMIASDAAPGIPTFGRDVPHPRAYGTFARVLGLYVREKHVLTLEAGRPQDVVVPGAADRDCAIAACSGPA